MNNLFHYSTRPEEHQCVYEYTPPLPRKGLDERISGAPLVVTRCTKWASGQYGFCQEHAYAAQLMDAAASQRFPRMELLTASTYWDKKTRKQEEGEAYGLMIGAGYDSWLVVCERATPERAAQILDHLKVQGQASGHLYDGKGAA